MTQEALRMAHKALIGLSIKHGEMTDEGMDAITAIEKALAKEKTLQALHSENERLGLYKDAYAEQEPSGHFLDFAYSDSIAYVHVYDQFRKGQQFYKSLPQRKWVGLTDEEIEQLHTAWVLGGGFRQLCNAIEAKLKEKNCAG
jgi:hypothetical protein